MVSYSCMVCPKNVTDFSKKKSYNIKMSGISAWFLIQPFAFELSGSVFVPSFLESVAACKVFSTLHLCSSCDNFIMPDSICAEM